METNIRIVGPGENLYFWAKRIKLKGQKLDGDKIRGVCSTIENFCGIPAVPYYGHENEILISSKASLTRQTVREESWVIELIDNDEKVMLEFSNEQHRKPLEEIYKRALLLNLSKRTDLWRIQDSARIFYEKEPIKRNGQTSRRIEDSSDDIDAYRRYEISSISIEGVGIGICVDISTAFFTNKTIEEYFKNNKNDRFELLSGRRGDDKKGTLMFRSPKNVQKCYFSKFENNLTCVTVPPFEVGGEQYNNLYDYYAKSPGYVNRNDSVAYVSFRNLPDPKPVPAKKLFLRVGNEMLPDDLSNLDKIEPKERKDLIENFWIKLDENPFGYGFLKLRPGYYSPAENISGICDIPNLVFGKNKSLWSPKVKNVDLYYKNFRNRKYFLEKNGCFYVPIAMNRKIYFCSPEGLNGQIIETFSESICEKIKMLTGIELEPEIIPPYRDYQETIEILKRGYEPGMVIFVFSKSEPSVYYHVSYELKGWGIKRATSDELSRKYRGIGKFDGKGDQFWNSFVDLNVLGIIQSLGCLPWVFEEKLNYEMHLALDVSEDKTHFALALFIFKPGMDFPFIITEPYNKADKMETINKFMLEDKLTKLLTKYKDILLEHQVKSLLVFRDGNDCIDEYNAIKSAINKLIKQEILNKDFKYDFIEYHKSTLKGIRMWDNQNDNITNVLEGSYFLIGNKNAVLATTGEATLNQGTAAPLLIKVKDNTDITKIIQDIFLTTQLNFSSPGVAQRLSLPMKRTDELLKERRAQEIKVV